MGGGWFPLRLVFRRQETGNRFSVNLLVTDALIPACLFALAGRRDLLGIGRGVSYELSGP